MDRRVRVFPWILALALGATPGCASIRSLALNQTGIVLGEGMKAINQESDVDFARDAFPGNLKTVEVLLAAKPDSEDLLRTAAMGFAAYTYLVLEDDMDLADAAGNTERVAVLKARAGALYARAQAYAARVFDPERRKVLEEGSPDQIKAALAKTTKDDVPTLFWYTFARAGRVQVDQSNPERIADLGRIEVLIDRVVELDASYYDGLPLLTAGSVYAGRAPMFGGQLDRGRKLFEQGIEVTKGKFLLSKFVLARYYAFQAQDHALYCRMLDEVLAAPGDEYPSQQLMNNYSKRWATRWRDRAGTLFAEGACAAPEPAKKVEDENELE